MSKATVEENLINVEEERCSIKVRFQLKVLVDI